MRLDEFLSRNHVSFERLRHPSTYTANRIAQALHVPGRKMAKSVLVRTNHGYMLVVLPASCRVDLDQLRQELGEQEVELATEDEIEQLFSDCERGAMPPFGSLYHLPTVVDETLAQDEIVFEGQDHEEAVKMAYKDYETIEHPRKGHFACHL
jgi:Ala-tRNA(Pro) deacylase